MSLKQAAYTFAWRLNVAGLWLGFAVCVAAIGMLQGVIPWPFEGTLPSQVEFLTRHFSLAAGSIIVVAMMQRVRGAVSNEPLLQSVSFGSRVMLSAAAAGFAGFTHIMVILSGWDDGVEDRTWVLWLLVPGVSSSIGWFYCLEPERNPGNHEEEHEAPEEAYRLTGAEIAIAEFEARENFDLGNLIRTGIIAGLYILTAYSGIAVFQVYAEFVTQAVIFDQFAGWTRFSEVLTAVLEGVAPGLIGLGTVIAVLLVAENVFIRLLGGKTDSEPFTEAEEDLIDETLERLEQTFDGKKSGLMVWLKGALSFVVLVVIGTAFGMLAFLPALLTIESDLGIGARLFLTARVGDDPTAVYFDGIGGFEFALIAAFTSLFSAVAYFLAKFVPQFTVYWWRFTEENQRRVQITKSIVEAVRSNEISTPTDLTIDRAAALTNGRFQRGSLLLGAAFAALAVFIWPFDRAHYALITENDVTGGVYYLPASVAPYTFDQVASVDRTCRLDGDGDDAISWKANLPNGGAVSLLRRWTDLSPEQRETVLNAGGAILTNDPERDDSIRSDLCQDLLKERYGEDSARIAPLFELYD